MELKGILEIIPSCSFQTLNILSMKSYVEPPTDKLDVNSIHHKCILKAGKEKSWF